MAIPESMYAYMYVYVYMLYTDFLRLRSYSKSYSHHTYLLEKAWNDGVIRSFALNGGQLLYEINRAHTRSVSAIAITSDDSKLVSGGCDGQVYEHVEMFRLQVITTFLLQIFIG